MTPTAPPTPAARPPSRTSALAVVVFLILICSPCLGLGGALAYQSNQGRFTRWRALAALPEPGVALVAGDPTRVFVSTGSGQVYVADLHPDDASAAGWHPAVAPYAIDEEADFEHAVFSGDVPPPPGETRETLAVSVFYADAAFETRYALLADGTVWVWEYGSSSNQALLVLLGGPVVGLGLGIVLVLLLLVVNLTQRRRAAPTG